MPSLPYNPIHVNTDGLGSSRFARRYLGNRKNLLPDLNGSWHHFRFDFLLVCFEERSTFLFYQLTYLGRELSMQFVVDVAPQTPLVTGIRQPVTFYRTVLSHGSNCASPQANPLRVYFTMPGPLYHRMENPIRHLLDSTLSSKHTNSNPKWYQDKDQKESSIYCFLFLQVLRCFTSLRTLPHTRVPAAGRRVSPFRDFRVKGWLAPRRNLSQPFHVFHRFLKPRHPPYTLTFL